MVIAENECKSGKVKTFGFTYEEIAQHLAVFYGGFERHQESSLPAHRKGLAQLKALIDSFALRHHIQPPEQVIAIAYPDKPQQIATEKKLLDEILKFQTRFGTYFSTRADENFLIQLHNICCLYLISSH